jgi:hypothetical protein
MWMRATLIRTLLAIVAGATIAAAGAAAIKHWAARGTDYNPDIPAADLPMLKDHGMWVRVQNNPGDGMGTSIDLDTGKTVQPGRLIQFSGDDGQHGVK